ncbi:MAG: lysophospholipid acyltransferase family protein [Candidatus Cloacimonetes bacterium]|jgi:1-acyl-sn-glycerol-3-phosphate acyltransferase|nr:lysophospholipid acyltransferase family protein [Candidatus Cloacimonadota bacterium]
MKHIRSVFLWTSGFIFFGIFSTIAILLTYIIPIKKLDPFIRSSLKLLFKVLFIKVKVEGKTDIDSSKTYLFMSNHASLFDVPLLKAYIPIYLIGIEAQHQFKWPFYGWLITRLEAIPIERDNIYASMRSIKKANKLLDEGTSIAILPEGTRTLTGEMQPLKKMPFMLAKKAGVDIIPIGLSGLYKLKPKGSWHITPSTITINFGDPITSEEVNDLSVEELRDKIYDSIKSLITEP